MVDLGVFGLGEPFPNGGRQTDGNRKVVLDARNAFGFTFGNDVLGTDAQFFRRLWTRSCAFLAMGNQPSCSEDSSDASSAGVPSGSCPTR